MDDTLRTIGLALKAGRLAVGEDPAWDACQARSCRLLLTAADASVHALRQAERAAEAGQCLLAALPYGKAELGAAVGRAGCAVAAVTDLGLAQAIAGKLAAADPERYGGVAQRLAVKAQRAAERREAQRRADTQRGGKRRPRKRGP